LATFCHGRDSATDAGTDRGDGGSRRLGLLAVLAGIAIALFLRRSERVGQAADAAQERGLPIAERFEAAPRPQSAEEGKPVVTAADDRVGTVATVDPDTGRATIDRDEAGPVDRARTALGRDTGVPEEIGRDDLARVTDGEVRLRY
jgi:hypothetical protein